MDENGLLKQLTKRLVERALDAEMSEHLVHDKNTPNTNPDGYARNCKRKKTLKGELGLILRWHSPNTTNLNDPIYSSDLRGHRLTLSWVK